MKLLKISLVTLFIVCALIIMPKPKSMITEAKAGALKIKTSNTSVMLGKTKKHKLKIYFNGRNVTPVCLISGEAKGICVEDFGYGDNSYNPRVFDSCKSKVKIKGEEIGKHKIKVTAYLEPRYVDDMLRDNYNYNSTLNRFESDYYDFDYESDPGSNYFYRQFSKSRNGYINHRIFGRINKKQYNTAFKATKTFKVRVKGYKKLKIKGKIEEHDGRMNDFMISLRNYSRKTITIYRDTKYDSVLHSYYKKYDRKLKCEKKRIKIKPGQEKLIFYDVKGRITKPGIKPYTLYGTLKYRGKKYAFCLDKEGTYTWKR